LDLLGDVVAKKQAVEGPLKGAATQLLNPAAAL
jgi:hypothetical protein